MNKGTGQNIMTQLGMTSDQYAMLTIFYYVSYPVLLEGNWSEANTNWKIPYIIGEAPSNLFLKRFTPSRWQSRIMITWGIALACHVACKNKEGLWVARFFLGLVGFSLLKLDYLLLIPHRLKLDNFQAFYFKWHIGIDRTKCRWDCCTSVRV